LRPQQGDWGGRNAFYARLAALVSGLPFVSKQAWRLSSTSALITRLALVTQLAGWLIGERGRCTRQREETSEEDYRSFASHGRLLSPPGAYSI
jgi:hypothetical protein